MRAIRLACASVISRGFEVFSASVLSGAFGSLASGSASIISVSLGSKVRWVVHS